MFEIQIKNLFTKSEYNDFLEFMRVHDYFWLGVDNSYCLAMFIQEFISTLEDNARKSKILEICTSNYPEIVGLRKENV